MAGSAQQLIIAPVRAGRGDEVRVDISIVSPVGKAPLILKWETIFPAQLVDVIGNGLELGKAAKDSDKSISCAMQKPYSYTCILFGGVKPLGNGVIATLHFKLHSDARPGVTAVRVQNTDAAGEDFKRFVLNDAQGSLEIH
jgi:hypothetical protein